MKSDDCLAEQILFKRNRFGLAEGKRFQIPWSSGRQNRKRLYFFSTVKIPKERSQTHIENRQIPNKL